MAEFKFTGAANNKEEVTSKAANQVEEKKSYNETIKENRDADLEKPFTYYRTITLELVPNFSLFRKVNDKSMPKRRDYIGSSIKSSQILSSNRGEVETYFPQLLGISSNNESFTTRLKQYLNNIHVHVDELGVTFDASFRFNTKRDYFKFKKKEEAIENAYKQVDRQNLEELKKALKIKIRDINDIESNLYKVGSPVNVAEYVLYRHCLLYRDVAKDTAFINSDSHIRFYFKDENKEKALQQKQRNAVNTAKRNYVELLGDDAKFKAVYIQYCVLNNMGIVTSLADERINQEVQLDRFSTNEPVKFNAICTDKDIQIKSTIELLISRGEFVRSQFNQNITTKDGDFIGANMKDAVVWFKNPENENIVAAFENKLKFM